MNRRRFTPSSDARAPHYYPLRGVAMAESARAHDAFIDELCDTHGVERQLTKAPPRAPFSNRYSKTFAKNAL